MQKILVVQTSFLGDVVLSTPVINGLNELYPDAELWVMTTPLAADIIKGHPGVHSILSFDKRGAEKGIFGLIKKATELRELGFDKVFALQRSFRTSLLLYLAGIPERTGFSSAGFSWMYNQTVERDSSVHDVWRNFSILSYEERYSELSPALDLDHHRIPTNPDLAIIAPGSVWKTKRWNAEGFAEVATYLLQNNWRVELVGSEAERDVADQVEAAAPGVINRTGATAIRDLCQLVSSAGLVVCNDSMVLHLASSFKVPTVAVFCSTSPDFGFGPWQNNAAIVEKQGLECKPCGRHGHKTCPTGTEECMRVSSKKVISAISELLKGERRCSELSN